MNAIKVSALAVIAAAAFACSSEAAPLPTNVAAMKSMVGTPAMQVRWGEWHGGWGNRGWGYRGGWGHRGWGYGGWGLSAVAAGAIVGGAIASSAYYDDPYYDYPYYGGGGYAYGHCPPAYGYGYRRYAPAYYARPRYYGW